MWLPWGDGEARSRASLSWIAVPVLAVSCGGLAFAMARGTAIEVACAAAAGAAIVHALRSLAQLGPAGTAHSPAWLVGAGTGALLATALVVDLPGRHAASLLALAAAAWTIAELARSSRSDAGGRPASVALAPAIAAAVLEPAFVALIAIAGTRLVPAQRRQRWTIAIPIIGTCAVVLAIVAGAADGGVLGTLGARWYGGPGRTTPAITALAAVGDALGPLVVVAAAGGLATLARVRLPNLGVVACACGAVLVDLRAGTPTTATFGIAALCAGAGIGRLTNTIQIRSGQTIAAATCGGLLLLPAMIQHVAG